MAKDSKGHGSDMRHDYRDEGGMYRCCTPAEKRARRAHAETQTKFGRFTHERIESARRMDVTIATPQSKPYFKNQRVDRTGFRANVVKG